jgi:hypothetical protein
MATRRVENQVAFQGVRDFGSGESRTGRRAVE